MRGSRIAYEIVKQQRREKARLKMVLELREKKLKERGGSNGNNIINKETANGITGKEQASKNKY